MSKQSKKAKLLVQEAIKMTSMIYTYDNEENEVYQERVQELLKQALKELEEENNG